MTSLQKFSQYYQRQWATLQIIEWYLNTSCLQNYNFRDFKLLSWWSGVGELPGCEQSNDFSKRTAGRLGDSRNWEGTFPLLAQWRTTIDALVLRLQMSRIANIDKTKRFSWEVRKLRTLSQHQEPSIEAIDMVQILLESVTCTMSGHWKYIHGMMYFARRTQDENPQT